MALDDRIFKTKREELLLSDDPRTEECGVESRSRMSLREDEPIIKEMFGVLRMKFHANFMEEEN